MWSTVRRALPYLALVALGSSASWGVYTFALLFSPPVVAAATGVAFELTYIGLSAVDLTDEQSRRKARVVSRWAVFTSVVFNVLAGYLHRQGLGVFSPVEAGLALLHGVPLAFLAYSVGELLLHNKPTTPQPKQLKGSGVKVTVERSETRRLEVLQLKEQGLSHAQVAKALGISKSRVSQLINT